MLDMDGNGRITKEDLAQVFKNSSNFNEEVINEMIQEADEKGNGEIAFIEFKNLMLCLQKNNINDQTGYLVDYKSNHGF